MPTRLPDALRASVEGELARAIEARWATRIWERDTSLWTDDPAAAHKIANRLGWLDAPGTFLDDVVELTAFATAVAEDGYTDVVVCGMGGSSLAPDVLAQVFPRSAHGLRIHVLDSTDPAALIGIEAITDPATTMRIIATKSGTTTETLAFLAHYFEEEQHRVGRVPATDAGNGFIAVTDPGDSLDAIPHSGLFRETFLNPPEVGGRYSALTYVGLVPAALQGLDIGALLDDGRLMAERCMPDDGANPGLALGVALGTFAKAGRDKLTLVIEPALAALGAWLEQLIAESTGKSGMGIVPVDGEPLAAPAAYGMDRVFVRIGRPTKSAWRSQTDSALDALATAGHPVIDLDLEGGSWVGGEFLRWEFATAVAGIVLGVNPFDEPNVTESKHNTARVLERYAADGVLPGEVALAEEGALRLIGDADLAGEPGPGTLPGELRRHLDRAPAAGYHAIGAYVAPTPARTAALRSIQALLRDRTGRATTLGYGPRYLHSTGQLHKGGPATGCFLQLVAGHPLDLPIPGRRETFGVLIDAQALGDLAALADHGLPVLRVHLSDDPDQGLIELQAALAAALA